MGDILSWNVEDVLFEKEKTELNGSKFLQGNGYMGYRGTLEEFTKEQLVACNLLGIYDKVGDNWREPINAPNGLFTKLYCDDRLMSVLSSEVREHKQVLDIKNGLHKRESVIKQSEDNLITIKSERFLGLENIHLICMKYSFKALKECKVCIETGIDGDVWDINGPHLKNVKAEIYENLIALNSKTSEMNCIIAVSEAIDMDFIGEQDIETDEKSIIRRITVYAKPEIEYTLYKYVSIFTVNDGVVNPSRAAFESCLIALEMGYVNIFTQNCSIWKERWEKSDVEICGDEEAQLALRYSIYHLLSIAPTHTDKASIPARGLSGQVYKGAVFWDTEMFMLPFFIYTNPEIARNLLMYRVNTLEGARRKALEYGYRGAFYAWESQDTGDDACTHFSVTDVFTGRPMRTYFRDKQVHISADVVYGIWQYYLATGDQSLLLDGGAEVILECARFFFSYSYFNKDKNRYEILDVTGPDEYHERVNNNAYTSMMVKYTLEVAIETLELLYKNYPLVYNELILKISFRNELENIKDMEKLLFVPKPDRESGIIEQFSGYEKLEEVTLKVLKERVLNPNEYFGGGNGLATTTKILKQADVVLILNLFKNRYSCEVKKANWEYYEPRTEHGSSLSSCVYAMMASEIGNSEWGYKYFMKTATIDLSGESKQYVGTLYIGGTHPAANGGAWMAAVLGFAGVSFNDQIITIMPQLPEKWESIAFNISLQGQSFSVQAGKTGVKVKASNTNSKNVLFNICGQVKECKIGHEI